MTKVISSCLVAVSLSLSSVSVLAETTLRFAHIWPATSDVQVKLFDEWAKAVTEESNGELRIEMYPSQTLVKANRAYDGAVKGLTDISALVQGYSAGRFPLSEIVQLPGISSSAPQGACILQTLYDEGDISQEYDDSHVLYMFTTGPAYLHTRDKEIQIPSDFEGLKIRRPNAVGGEMLVQMGASPVGMSAPDIYQSLERRVVDGLSFPFEAMKVFRVNELVNYHLQIPYASGLFAVTMNKRSYNRLSPEMKKVIDNNSGMKWSMRAANVFAQLDKEGLQEAKDQGDVIHVVSDPINDPDWGGLLKKGTNAYLDRIESEGRVTARDVYQKAISLTSNCGV
jgi:TRAP-type C4-dicarboxylate transport system substrate-binding protein